MGEQVSISEKKQVIEQHNYYFDDLIIEEILTRLPIKSIIRFKSVSKQWYSTLSSSNFAKAHLIKSPFAYPSAPVNTLFIRTGKNYHLFSYNDDQISGNFQDNLLFSYNDDQISGNFQDNLVKIDADFGIDNNDCLKLIGSCNGLVCLTPEDSDKYFILWNPATRKMHRYERIDDETKVRQLNCGFGYASSVDDYKFIRISRRRLGTGDSNCIVHIFSLRENKWTRSDFDYGHDILVLGHAVLTNERLYWPAIVRRAGHIILSFDLVVERFEVIKLECWNFLGVMGGCLSRCNSYRGKMGNRLIHIFESSGVIAKSIGLPNGLRLTSRMIGFTKTGKFFVTGVCSDEVSNFMTRMLGVVDTGTNPMQYTTLLRFK